MTNALLVRLEAESAIRRLIGLYCDAVNRRDADAAGVLFAPDCRIRIAGGPERIGRELQTEGMRETFAGFDFLRQQCDVVAIDVDGDSARARLLVFEAAHKQGDAGLGQIWGTYQDEYIRLPEGWRFHSRRYTLQLRALVKVAKLQQVAEFEPEIVFRP